MTKMTAVVKSRRERSSSRAARRRRIEMRRVNIVVDHEQKRRRRDAIAAVIYRGFEKKSETTKEVVVLCESVRVKMTPLIDPEVCPKYGVVSVCGRRREMEDAVAVHPFLFRRLTEYSNSGFHYFGVFDGHGCSHVAMRCRERLHELVREEIENDGEWKGVMERSFTRMDNEVVEWNASGALPMTATCRCELQMPECNAVGSTAVVAVVTPGIIVVANCGDSRAVLCRNGEAISLSSDHKPDRPDELDRIRTAGGRVIYWNGPRVLGVLAMSRAIGDSYLKPYVISKPEVTVTERIASDDFLILASDGLWDVVSNETACSVVRMCLTGKTNRDQLLELSPTGDYGLVRREEKSDNACKEASLLLMRLALARHSSDNVSVVVVNLRSDT